MGLMAKSGNGGEIPDANTYIGKLIWIVDLGTHYSEKYDSNSSRILLTWELDAKNSDGNGFITSKSYTLTLGKKAYLRRDLQGMIGRELTQEEALNGFDLKQILGCFAFVEIIHAERNNKTYANVEGIVKLNDKTKEVIDNSDFNRETLVYDMDNPDAQVYAKLPDWVKDQIDSSQESQDRVIEAEKEQEQVLYSDEPDSNPEHPEVDENGDIPI